MIYKPAVQRVEIPKDEVQSALLRLTQSWITPAGEEIIDRRTFNIFKKTMSQGYFNRLIWPHNINKLDILEWFDSINQFRKLGLI